MVAGSQVLSSEKQQQQQSKKLHLWARSALRLLVLPLGRKGNKRKEAWVGQA